jgi:GNAT superfamily N-acetyltransferase
VEHAKEMAVIEQRNRHILRLSNLTSADLAAAASLSRDVGWPHRLEDWQFGLSLGEGVAGYVDQSLVATAMWWRYERRITRIGMVIVDPKMQRLGVGRSLMHAVLDRIDTPMVLNATETGELLYRRLGFEECGAIRQHQGTAPSVPLAILRPGERIRPSGRRDMQTLINLDAAACGVRREKIIAALLGYTESVALDADGRTVGFALFRRFGHGYVIGPVVAQDELAARALIAHWVGSKAGKFMRIDVPDNGPLSDWLGALGLVQTSVVKTLRRGPLPTPEGQAHLFALVNQALG